MPGPIPNRSDQRVRRNIGDPIEKVTAIGAVEIPELNLGEVHPLVTELYEAMTRSAQRKFFEPSDWAYTKVTLHFLNGLPNSSRPSSQMLASVNQMLSALLVSEGERRRVRIEVERGSTTETGDVLQISDLFKQRLAQG